MPPLNVERDDSHNAGFRRRGHASILANSGHVQDTPKFFTVLVLILKDLYGEPGGTRTRDHRIKSAVTVPIQDAPCRKESK